MSGGSANHSRIAINVVRELEDARAAIGRLCYVYNSDMAVRLSSRRYTYPDATVTCEERDQPTGELMTVLALRVIVEVLSDATEAYDRGTKFGLYRACPHVQTYILIATKDQTVDVYSRTPHIWTYQSYGSGDIIAVESLGISVPVVALYRMTDVPASDEPDGEV